MGRKPKENQLSNAEALEQVRRILAKNEYPSLDLAYDEAKRMLDAQFSQIDGLDVKASVLLAAAGVLLTLYLTVLPTMIRHPDPLTLDLVVGAFAAVFFSAVFGVLAIRLKVHQTVPKVESLFDKYLAWPEKETRYSLLCEFEYSIIANRRLIRPKFEFVSLAMAALQISFLLSATALFYQLWLLTKF